MISTILAQAEKEMLIPFNPARRATPPKVEKTQANYFQIETVNKITKCLDNEPIKWKALTYLLILSGCRRGEILGLKWKAVDLDKGILKIENNLLYSKTRGIYEDTTKNRKSRLVMIPPEAVKIMKLYRVWYLQEKMANGDRWQANSVWKGSDFVFIQDDVNPGNPMHPDSITVWLKRFSERHELPHINPHAFRHTLASVLISRGIDIVTVSKTLGHEKVSTTVDIYAEMMKEASEEASETIAKVIFRS